MGCHVWIKGGGVGYLYLNIGFSSNTGPDPLKNLKATKPAFNVGPSSAHQRSAIQWCLAGGPMMLMAFRLCADNGPLLVVLGSSLPSSTKKKLSKLDPL